MIRTSARTGSTPATRVGRVFTLVAIAWGVAAFGAVYSWAYWPLAALCVTAGLIGLLSNRHRNGIRTAGLTFAMVSVALAGLAQLIPLPIDILARISPSALSLVSSTDFGYGIAPAAFHGASIQPLATLTAVLLYASLATLLLGAVSLFSLEGPRRLAEGLTIVGVIVALAGIVQMPLYAGEIYGFWTPQEASSPFGPFVNRNHFAGWMLLTLPLTLALVCASIAHSMRGLKPGWRYRLLWLSSAEANRLILLAGAAVVMGLSLVLTMSRSGMSALVLSLALTGWFVARSVSARSRKAVAGGYLLLLAATLVAWAGADRLVARFSDADWSEFNNRRGAWADALHVAAVFPLTGTGLGTYDTVARFYQRHDLDSHYGQAHNDYLQLAAEGGLLVSVPLAICVVLFVRDVRKGLGDDPGSTSWWLRRGAIAALVAIALQETVDFSLQMPGNAALFAVVCAIALHRAPPRRVDVQPAKAGLSLVRI